MLRAVLFDLDDTLLGNDIDLFLQQYFPLIARHVGHLLEPERFLRDLLSSTQVMMSNADLKRTNQDVFWADFCQRSGLAREELEPTIDAFYREQFIALRGATQRRPEAADLVRLCFDAGWQVAIATNPVFPQEAIEQRLDWAGVGVDQFAYGLVTSYENMHATKPHESYYREILAALNVSAERALMVGDDWQNDIVPASRLGMATFWVTDNAKGSAASDSDIAADGQGSLADLLRLLRSGWLQAAEAR
ncbi:MAG: HAD family hydrolase [Candidatus Promineifilaceae bacterium]|nr:HAD family hydrolase [Candidatus Promineifilaceae bacterium]